jgi:dihydroorotate dehydrogenase electron transfer subunit
MAVHRRHPAEGLIEIVYGVVGHGTRQLARLPVGAELTVIGPLGNGFDLGAGRGEVLALARGVGVCAVMGVVEDCAASGRPVLPVLSGRTAGELIGVADCAELSVRPWSVTDTDGTSAVEAVEAGLLAYGATTPPDLIVTSGSRRLIDLAGRLGDVWGVPVQVSVEARMACGLGYCHGCAVPRGDTEGPLVCQDGPVFGLLAESAREP